jgi:chromosome segregation ATPase
MSEQQMGGQRNDSVAGQVSADQQRIRVLEAGHRQLAEQLAEVAVAMHSVDKCLRKGEERMGSMEAELSANSAVTIEVRNILSAAKGAFTVLGWMGSLAKWTAAVGGAIVSIYVAAYMVTHNGKAPWP